MGEISMPVEGNAPLGPSASLTAAPQSVGRPRINVSSAALALLMFIGCTPSLSPPSENIRLTGTIRGAGSGLVEIEVYEHCSRRFAFFKRCPGNLLGQAKIAKPGPFLIQIGDDSQDVTIVAFRGSERHESVCAAKTLSLDPPIEPMELTLAAGPCPVDRPASLTGAGGGYTSGGGHGGHGH